MACSSSQNRLSCSEDRLAQLEFSKLYLNMNVIGINVFVARYARISQQRVFFFAGLVKVAWAIPRPPAINDFLKAVCPVSSRRWSNQVALADPPGNFGDPVKTSMPFIRLIMWM